MLRGEAASVGTRAPRIAIALRARAERVSLHRKKSRLTAGRAAIQLPIQAIATDNNHDPHFIAAISV